MYDKPLASAESLAQHSRSWDKRHAVTGQLLRASESVVLDPARQRSPVGRCLRAPPTPANASTNPMGALQSTHQPVTQPDRPSHGLDLIASQKQTSICQLFRCDAIGFPPIQRWATSGRDAQARRGERRTQRCVPTSRGLEPAHAFFRHASPRLASHEPGVGPASAGDTSGTRRRIGPPDPAGVAEAHHTDHACRPPNRHAPQCRACLKRQLSNVDMRPYWLFLGLLRPGLQVDRRSVLLSCIGRYERHA